MDSTVLALVGASWIVLPGAHPPAVVETSVQVIEANGSRAVLEWPLLMGEEGDMAVGAMNEALSWEAVTGESMEETVEVFSRMQGGHTGSDFTVNHNAGGILDITLRLEFLGAYPSTGHRHFCFDVSTGRSVRFSELLRPGGRETLAGVLDSMLWVNIAIEAADSLLDPEMYEGHGFGVENLESFSITENGVWFHYEFGFPHAVMAAEPDGELFVPAGRLVPLLFDEYVGGTAR
ncbi:MAG: hypothetical protein R6V62_10630 [Candidatus Fermentibacteraceae bacterium]